jgi:hypothetical protein
MNTEAWKHLSGNSVKVLLALVIRDNSTRNGAISFSVREAAKEANISEPTASRCLQELQDLGFIRCTQKGGFNRKVSHASLWRYTWQAWPGGRPAAPTRDFEKWRYNEQVNAEKRGANNLHRTGQKTLSRNDETGVTVQEICTAPIEEPQISVTQRHKETCTHIINHRDSESEPDQLPPEKPLPVAAAPLGHSGTEPVKVTGWDGPPEEVLANKIAAGGMMGERWASVPKEKALAKIVAEQRRRAREQAVLKRRNA